MITKEFISLLVHSHIHTYTPVLHDFKLPSAPPSYCLIVLSQGRDRVRDCRRSQALEDI